MSSRAVGGARSVPARGALGGLLGALLLGRLERLLLLFLALVQALAHGEHLDDSWAGRSSAARAATSLPRRRSGANGKDARRRRRYGLALSAIPATTFRLTAFWSPELSISTDSPQTDCPIPEPLQKRTIIDHMSGPK